MKWEYRIVDKEKVNDRTIPGLKNFFDNLGDNDWELVAVDNLGNFYFKRPKAEPA